MALATLRPDWRVIGVQPEANGAMARSFREGKPVMVGAIDTIADALVARQPGARALELVRRHVADVITVTEDELLAATRALASETKLIVEPGGAAGVAALMAGKVRADPRSAIAVLSGGNVPLTKLATWLESDGATARTPGNPPG
jgi:threonine dehydratase